MPQTIQCPNCHAPLDVDPAAPSFQCSYCNHHSKNTMYSPPKPRIPRPQAPQIHVPHVPQPHQYVQQAQKNARKYVYIIIAISLFISLFSMVPILCMSRGVQNAVSTAVQSATSGKLGGSLVSWSWQSYRPFITDADGDGFEDVVGRIQVDHKEIFLAAISGKDYTELWRSVEISKEASPYLAGDKMVLAETNILTGYHLSSGKRAWATTLSDKIKEVGHLEGSLKVMTIDKKWHLINLQTGALSPDSAGKPLRYHLRSDKGFSLIPSIAQLDLKYDKWKGYRVWRAFCEEGKITRLHKGRAQPWHSRKAFCDAPRGLGLLTRASGSKVPFLMGYDTKTKEKLWERQLTPPGSLDELSSGFNQPRAVIAGDRALFIYMIDKGPYQMELINLPDGKVIWKGQVESTERGPDHLYGAMLTEDRAYVKLGWGPVEVFNAADGTPVTSIGK